jgi:hypothetical protein
VCTPNWPKLHTLVPHLTSRCTRSAHESRRAHAWRPSLSWPLEIGVSRSTARPVMRPGRFDGARQGAGPATSAIDMSFIRTIITHTAAVHGIELSAEEAGLARVALSHLKLVGKSKERDRRPTQDELDELIEYFDWPRSNGRWAGSRPYPSSSASPCSHALLDRNATTELTCSPSRRTISMAAASPTWSNGFDSRGRLECSALGSSAYPLLSSTVVPGRSTAI